MNIPFIKFLLTIVPGLIRFWKQFMPFISRGNILEQNMFTLGLHDCQKFHTELARLNIAYNNRCLKEGDTFTFSIILSNFKINCNFKMIRAYNMSQYCLSNLPTL
jgi:hypothetical protein